MSPSADRRGPRAAYVGIAGTTLLVLAIVLTLVHRPGGDARADEVLASPTSAKAASSKLPPVRHVFIVNVENKGFRTTWGRHSAAPYLARTLRAKGLLLTQYY